MNGQAQRSYIQAGEAGLMFEGESEEEFTLEIKELNEAVDELTEQDIQEYINDMLNEKKELLNEKEETPNHKARPSCMHRGSVSIRLLP
jgi:hypothetical protein